MLEPVVPGGGSVFIDAVPVGRLRCASAFPLLHERDIPVRTLDQYTLSSIARDGVPLSNRGFLMFLYDAVPVPRSNASNPSWLIIRWGPRAAVRSGSNNALLQRRVTLTQ